MGNIPKPYFYVSTCPDTGYQFLVQYKKDGNIIELTTDNIQAIKNIGQEKTLKEACKDLIFNVDIVDTSETPTNADIENLLNSLAECREIVKLLEAKEKTYIFLTVDGQTKDNTGCDVENCQMLAIAKGEDALTAYNNMLSERGWTGMLSERGWTGMFDTCFCYELTSENMVGFDLISHCYTSDKSCPDCDETLCQDMSDNELFCTECGYEESSDIVYHCIKCEKAIGKSDFEIGDGKCVECNQ